VLQVWHVEVMAHAAMHWKLFAGQAQAQLK
jgi:hypothetical protein